MLNTLTRIRLANAPCSFGVMAGFQPDPPLTYLDVLDQMAEAGFAGTELGDRGFMPGDGIALLPELLQRGLAMVGAFTPLELTDPSQLTASMIGVLDTARLLAACATSESEPGPYVILAAGTARHPHRRHVAGRVRPEDCLSHEEWRDLTRAVDQIAREVRDQTGIRTVFHPHCATPVETLDETVRFTEMTDPSLVGLCFDTGHVAYAGDDPAAWLSLFASRTELVHFKDMDASVASQARTEGWDYAGAVRHGLFCPLGEGSIDFVAAHSMLAHAGYTGWIVVEDEMPPGRVPPLEAARRDLAFLRKLGL